MTQYSDILKSAKTIVWNGPMGVVEVHPFEVGTQQVARAMAKATENGAVSIVGGGDSAAAVESFKMADRFTHVSTGGGASLQMLEGKPFDSLGALDEA
jgi:phosphoglycerate kinase